MGLSSRTLFGGEVMLSGLVDDPEATDTVAQAQFKAHGRMEQPRDLAAFSADERGGSTARLPRGPHSRSAVP